MCPYNENELFCKRASEHLRKKYINIFSFACSCIYFSTENLLALLSKRLKMLNVRQ